MGQAVIFHVDTCSFLDNSQFSVGITTYMVVNIWRRRHLRPSKSRNCSTIREVVLLLGCVKLPTISFTLLAKLLPTEASILSENELLSNWKTIYKKILLSFVAIN